MTEENKMIDEETKKKMENVIKRLPEMFPHRPDDKYCNEKIYSGNDMNQVVRQAIKNEFNKLLGRRTNDE